MKSRFVGVAVLLWFLPGGALADQGNSFPMDQFTTKENAKAGFLLKRQTDKKQAEWLQYKKGVSRALGPIQVQKMSGGSSPGVEVTSQMSSLSFDFPNKAIKTTTRFQIKNISTSGDLSSVYFYLSGKMMSGNTSFSDSEGPLFAGDQGYDLWFVYLRKPIDKGETAEITVDQQGVPNCQTQFLDLIVCAVDPNLSFSVNSSWQPVVYDIEAQDFVYPESLTFEIVLPNHMDAATNAIFIEKKDNPDGTKTLRFEENKVGYVAFSAGPFVVGSTPWGTGKEAKSYLLPGFAMFASDWRDKTIDIMLFFEKHYGPYTPQTVGFAQIPDEAGAGYGVFKNVFIPGA
ncbi:MAG: hypothetical protein V1754_07210, partial [Pseudomonadota bacterium]